MMDAQQEVSMTQLMLHAGAKPIEMQALRALATPAATATHVPLPHYRVVDLVAHSLGYFGHEIAEQHFGVTEDGARFFGVLSLRSEWTGYTDTVGLRNSHDKKFPVGISFGSRVFVCDNLAFVAEHVIKRKHTANAKRDLPGLIGELIEPLALTREAQHQAILTYQDTAVDTVQADHAIMEMYRQEVIGVQRIADVYEQWERPTFECGDKTAWRLFNAATRALNGKVVENPGLTPKLHKIIDGLCDIRQ
jgi:hypothetical protein